MFRTVPVRTVLFTVVPIVLAFAQVTNSVLNGLSFAVSIPFAIVMLGFAGIVTQYQFAQFRREELERSIFTPR